MALARLVIFGGAFLTLLYLAAAWFMRSTKREALEKVWDAANPDGNPELRRAEVEEGVTAFTKTLPYRALALIYVVPVVTVIVILVTTNSN